MNFQVRLLKMQVLRVAFVVNILVMVDKFIGHIPPVAVAERFPFEKPFVGLATGTLTSTILEKLLHVDEQERPKCALSLENKLTSYRLTDPVLYLGHGENPMPVPLKIETKSTVEMIFEAAAGGKDTSGFLFYKIETTEHYLRIFWKISGPSKLSTYTPNRFDVQILAAKKFFDNEKSLEASYNEIKAFSEKMTKASDFTVTETLVRIPGKSVLKNPLKITLRAEMTTEKDAKFTVSISDNLSPATPTQLDKRLVTGTLVATSLMSTALGVMFKKIMQHIPKEQTGSISLENTSEKLSLINPSWFIQGGHTSSIVPWDIKPTEKGTISWRSPLAGTKIAETFQHTVHFLSYQIESTDYHVVAGTWFPFKMGPGQSVFTLFVIEKKLEVRKMKDILSAVADVLAKKGGNMKQLVAAIKSDRVRQYILNDIPDKNIHGLRSSKYQKYWEWQYPVFTPQVKLKQGTEYHAKIIAAVSFGKALGVDIKVEIVPGKSPQAATFKNPQKYVEPPQALASQPALTMVSDWSGTAEPANQIQSNAEGNLPTSEATTLSNEISTSKNSPEAPTAEPANQIQSNADGNLPTSEATTLSNEISTSKNSPEATTAEPANQIQSNAEGNSPTSEATTLSNEISTSKNSPEATTANQIQSDLQSANGNAPVVTTATDSNLPTSGDDTMSMGISTDEISPEATTEDMEMDAVLRSTASKAATAKRTSTTAKKSGKHFLARSLRRGIKRRTRGGGRGGGR